jgi:hypothetical protein
MPAVLVADGSAISVATLTLTNAAGATSGSIPLDHLDVQASDRDGRAAPIGAAVSRLQAWVADTVWADVVLADTATVARLQGATTLALAPGHATPVSLRATLRTGTGASSLRLGIDESGIAVIQPASALLSIAVLAAPGERMPFWTQVGNFSNQSLAGSWSNYPNPFPAGRGETRFVFYLPSAARVSLDIWTPRGDRVVSAASNAAFGSGLHQELSWDGRNSRGQAVFNGVYVAELNVRFDDGTSTRLLRNIVVVR